MTANDEALEDVAATAETDATAAPPAPQRRVGRLVKRLRANVIPALWIVAVVVSVSLLAALWYWQFRPDQATDEAAARAAMSAATDGTVAVYSYSADTLDSEIANAKSHLTGDLLAEYEQNSQTAVAAVAMEKLINTKAAVVGSAVTELHPDSAVVLIFMNQTTTTKESPGPSVRSGSMVVSLSKVDGKWLLSSMKPV